MSNMGDIKRKVALETKLKFIETLFDDALLETLASQEHLRWSSWQKYVHKKCIKNEDGSLTIPKEYVDWWENEIKTPYNYLTENIKESDRKEVRSTLGIIKNYLIFKFF